MKNPEFLCYRENIHLHKLVESILIIFILHFKLGDKFIMTHLSFIKKSFKVVGDNWPQNS